MLSGSACRARSGALEPPPAAGSAAHADAAGLRRCDVLLLALLALVGIAGFLLRGGGAYVWPTADNFPLFQALADPDAAWVAQDAFTQALLDPGPRHVFTGSVAWLARSAGVDPYQIFVALGLLFAVVSPQLIYLMLSRCPLLGRSIAAEGLVPRLVIAIGIALWATVYDHRHAFASWPPLYAEATAHGCSLFLGLAGLALLWSAWQRQPLARGLGWILLALATAYHPANGLAMWCFWAISTLRLDRGWLLHAGASLACWVALPALLLRLAFPASLSQPVDVERLVEAYVIADQPHHYHLPFLLGQLKTWANLAIFGLCLAIGWSAGVFAGSVQRWRLAALLALPLLALLAQHAFAFWWPSTTVILAGPARLLMVVPWLAAVVFALGLARWAWAVRIERVWASGWQPSGRLAVALLLASGTAAWLLGLRLHAPAEYDVDPEHLAIARSIADLSAPDELVFATDRGLAVDIRHFAERAVYFSSNFPFHARHLDEFCRRSEVYHAFAADPAAVLPLLRQEGIGLLVARHELRLDLPVLSRTRRYALYALDPELAASSGSAWIPQPVQVRARLVADP